MVLNGEPSLLRMRKRPGFSVMRKRPLGNNATAHGTSRFEAMVATLTSTVL
jgi:hypothetical protein